MEGKTVRPLGRETDKAFALLGALDEGQKKQAILGFQMRDLVLGPGRDGQTIRPEGIKGSALTDRQREMLLDLAREWTGIASDAVANAKMAELEKHLDETWFAWSGPTDEGTPAYFRIQGPTVFIEYAPQRLGGDGTITPDEAAAYSESLKRDLTLRLDGRDVELKLTTCNCPAPAELRSGSGIIRVEFAATPGPLAAGAHRLTLENRHLLPVSVYLFNAAQPKSSSVRITRQTRNENQSEGEIEFTIRPAADSSTDVGIVASLAALLVAVFAGVWRARKSSAPSTG